MEEEERSRQHKERYLKLIQQRVDRADYLTYISEYSQEEAQKYLKTGNKPSSVIYNGCNAPVNKSFQQPAYVPARPFLFSIGLFMSRKNFHVLPALLQGNDRELVIAGLNEMPYKETILEEARKLNVLDRIHLVGPNSEGEKFWYYKNAEAFLFPSLGEGFGLPVIEAMGFGKPVFLSKSTCLPEIGGEVAYYFDSFEPSSMQKIFAEGMQHYRDTQPQEKIRKRAGFFSWEKAAKEYVDVYRQV
jgi:glycosyltransferase involved in cell wall biosynthesis